MYSTRKVKTKSVSTAIQVVQYIGHRSKIAKHIVSAKDDFKIRMLLEKAKDWIDQQTTQANLFPEQKQRTILVDRGECVAVTHEFAYQFSRCCIQECDLSHLPSLLMDLTIMRLIESASKLRSILSLRNIRLIVWNITETHLQDTLTKETFKFRSPTKEIMNSHLAPLI